MIVVTGGAGFIGHNLAVLLRNSGYEVSCVDNLMVNNLISVIGNNDSLKFKALNKDAYASFRLLSFKYEIPNIEYRGMKIWSDESINLYPYGYPYAFSMNQLHQYILIFRKVNL